jgi:hypothetical protein
MLIIFVLNLPFGIMHGCSCNLTYLHILALFNWTNFSNITFRIMIAVFTKKVYQQFFHSDKILFCYILWYQSKWSKIICFLKNEKNPTISTVIKVINIMNSKCLMEKPLILKWLISSCELLNLLHQDKFDLKNLWFNTFQ